MEGADNESMEQRHARVNEMESLLRKMDKMIEKAMEEPKCLHCVRYGGTGGPY